MAKVRGIASEALADQLKLFMRPIIFLTVPMGACILALLIYIFNGLTVTLTENTNVLIKLNETVSLIHHQVKQNTKSIDKINDTSH